MNTISIRRAIVGLLVLTLAALATPPSLAQGAGEPDPRIDLSSLEVGARFDFLIGDWTYEFDGGHGKTHYERAATGNAITEHLAPGVIGETAFTGLSILMRDGDAGWKHNWIDTMGNVLEGRGGMKPYAESDLPAMQMEFQLGTTYFRHVWYDITEDRFETDLLASRDGENYQLIRRMPFLRVR